MANLENETALDDGPDLVVTEPMRREECRFQGHDFLVVVETNGLPRLVVCNHCGAGWHVSG